MAETTPLGDGGQGGDEPTTRMPPSPDQVLQAVDRPSTIRLFNTRSFFRLWLAQVVSGLGDWIGFFALAAIAFRLGGNSRGTAVSLVLSMRMIPGFFFGSMAGVFADRMDRRKLMIGCDIGRGIVLAFIPFFHHIWQLMIASFVIELLTLLWSSAKEASVPNIVQKEFLTTANSLSVAAAYGTFPLGGVVFTLLAGGAKWLGHFNALHSLEVNRETLAIFFDVFTFFISASMVATLRLPTPAHSERRKGGLDFGRTFAELREGWRFIGQSPRVRAVIVGMATGLFGGAMVVPIGQIFATESLGAGPQGFGALLTALGFGMALSVIGLSVFQKRIPHEWAFVVSVFGGGVSLLLGAASSTLTTAVVWVGLLGLFAGGVYVLGFTIIQSNVEDELRGRIFATLYTLTRFCVFLALVLSPLLSDLFGKLSKRVLDGRISIGGIHVALPGARLTLWLGGAIILGAGVLSLLSLRSPVPQEAS